MAIALQEAPAPGQSTTQNPSQAFVSNVAAGDLLILDLSWGVVTGSVSQVLDTTDAIPWTAVDLLQAQGRSNTVYIKVVRTAGACTVTASTDSSRAYAYSLYRFSGLTINLDGTVKHNSGAATTNPITASETTTFAAALVFAALRGGTISVSPSSPWVSEATGGHGTAYQIRSATGTLAGSWTTSSASFLNTILALRAGSTIFLNGLGSSEADGTPSVSPGPVTIALIGLGSAEVDGTPSVSSTATIGLIGLASSEVDGTPSVGPGPVSIALIGTPSSEADGTPTVKATSTVALTGLGSTEADGIPRVTQAIMIALIGLGSTEGDGIPSVAIVTAPSFIDLIGTASTEADGIPSVTPPRNPLLSYAMIQYWRALGPDGFWGYCVGVCSTPNNPDVPVQQEPVNQYPNGPKWLQRMDNGSLGANFELGGNNGPWETLPNAPCELDPIIATQANDSYATWQPTLNVP